MKQAISLLNLLEDIHIDELLKLIKRYGFEYVELPLTYVLDKNWEDINPEDLKVIEFRMKKHGLKVNSFQSITFGIDYDICDFDKTIKKNLFEHFESIAECGEYLGIEHVVYGAPKSRTGTNKQAYIEFFKYVAKIFKEHGIKFCLENNSSVFGNNFGYEAAYIDNFIKDSKIDNLYCHFDTGNEFIESATLPIYKSVTTMHVSNHDKYYNFMEENSAYEVYTKQCLAFADNVSSVTLENLNKNTDHELIINKFKRLFI